MLACNQPWVTAKSRAAALEANVLSKLKTRQYMPLPCARWNRNEARKRPQPVGWIVGETTYSPMGMAWFEMVFSQGCGVRNRPQEHPRGRRAAALQARELSRFSQRQRGAGQRAVGSGSLIRKRRGS